MNIIYMILSNCSGELCSVAQFLVICALFVISVVIFLTSIIVLPVGLLVATTFLLAVITRVGGKLVGGFVGNKGNGMEEGGQEAEQRPLSHFFENL